RTIAIAGALTHPLGRLDTMLANAVPAGTLFRQVWPIHEKPVVSQQALLVDQRGQMHHGQPEDTPTDDAEYRKETSQPLCRAQ
ncbi:hypothetical protein KQH49_15250, partial [Mycetohabitans sp. B5]